MTSEEMMDRFWREFTDIERRWVETAWHYQKAIKEGNPAKAQEVAFSYLCGSDTAQRHFIADSLQKVNALCPD
jgi:hypothetical protein